MMAELLIQRDDLRGSRTGSGVTRREKHNNRASPLGRAVSLRICLDLLRGEINSTRGIADFEAVLRRESAAPQRAPMATRIKKRNTIHSPSRRPRRLRLPRR